MIWLTVRMALSSGSICSKSGRGALFQEPIDRRPCRIERGIAALRIDGKALGAHEFYVLHAEEPQKVAYVGGLGVERRTGVESAACREHIDLLALEQDNRALCRVIEGVTGTGDVIKVSLEL